MDRKDSRAIWFYMHYEMAAGRQINESSVPVLAVCIKTGVRVAVHSREHSLHIPYPTMSERNAVH